MIAEALDKLWKLQMQILTTIVAELFDELIQNTPVDTGQLRTSWDMIKVNETHWTITNNMEYASIIFDGRRLVAGKMHGSNQLPDGIDPILAKYNQLLEERLNNIRM